MLIRVVHKHFRSSLLYLDRYVFDAMFLVMLEAHESRYWSNVSGLMAHVLATVDGDCMLGGGYQQ